MQQLTTHCLIKKNVISHFYVHVMYFIKMDQNSFFLKSIMSTKKQTNIWMHWFWTKRLIQHNTDKIQIIIDDVYNFFYSLFAIAIKLTLIAIIVIEYLLPRRYHAQCFIHYYLKWSLQNGYDYYSHF